MNDPNRNGTWQEGIFALMAFAVTAKDGMKGFERLLKGYERGKRL